MTRYNSDELRMILALLSRLAHEDEVSERTLDALLQELKAKALSPRDDPGLLREFRLVFRDGTTLISPPDSLDRR